MKIRTHLAIIILMLLGTVILLNQVNQPVFVMKAEANSEQNEGGKTNKSQELEYVLQANVAINSFTSITLHQELYQIREIILDEVDDPQPGHELACYGESDHFRTLFRQVISPNAP